MEPTKTTDAQVEQSSSTKTDEVGGLSPEPGQATAKKNTSGLKAVKDAAPEAPQSNSPVSATSKPYALKESPGKARTRARPAQSRSTSSRPSVGTRETLRVKIDALKKRCPMPLLMRRIGLKRFAVKNCSSPFRSDTKPSWGIFKGDGGWFFKDHGTGEKGDEIALLALHLKLHVKKDFWAIVDRYQEIAERDPSEEEPEVEHPEGALVQKRSGEKPDCGGYVPGNEEQFRELSASRGISVDGLRWATQRGVLVFGQWHGISVYGVRDRSGRVMEIRRLDGCLFPQWNSLQERKSHAIRGSQKNWPVGILEAKDSKGIILMEGIPDFLAAHQLIFEKGLQNIIAPVAMLAASVQIATDAVPLFEGKQVRMFPHADKAGIDASKKWGRQLQDAGLKQIDYFSFSELQGAGAGKVKDMCDFLAWRKNQPTYAQMSVI